ncbi:MAG: DUF1269 domain-containing protein [Acidimicrobiia bacterium]|nr:DUF1269 domain-containing protein [Acidimicrobiia bacterium]
MTPETDQAALVAFRFDDPLLAQEANIAAIRLERRGSLKLEDAVIVAKSTSGRIRLHQTRDMSAGQGATTGGMWGMLAGWIVMAPLAGAALGAALGGLFGRLRDIGIDDNEMRKIGDDLDPGETALFLLVSEAQLAHCLQELRRFDARVLTTTCPDSTRHLMEEALATPM